MVRFNQLWRRPAALLLGSVLLFHTSHATVAQQPPPRSPATGPAGTITGTVNNATTGTPVAGVVVDIRSEVGRPVVSATTDSQGRYSTTPLAVGDYYVETNPMFSGGLIGQMYDKAPCWSARCAPVQGTIVTVVANRATAAIDFGLAPGGDISGTVTNGATAAPVANVRVEVSCELGIVAVTTDALGRYRAAGLPAGSYFVRALVPSSLNLIEQIYAGPCPGGDCQQQPRKAVVVKAPASVPDINFALSQGGSITGRVTDKATGKSVAGVQVTVLWPGRSVVTDERGTYTVDGLASGTYFVQTQVDRASALVDQVYESLLCWQRSCDQRQGTPVKVTAPNVTSSIDLALQRGAQITGRVTDASTGTPVPRLSVDFIQADGRIAGTAQSGVDGNYVSPALPGGTYFVRTWGYRSNYLDQLYDGLPCDGRRCQVRDGTAVKVADGGTVQNINFKMAEGGSISGVVADTSTGSPVKLVQVSARSSNGFGGTAETDAEGRYTIRGLKADSYRVVARPAWEGILGAGLNHAQYLESLLPQWYGGTLGGNRDREEGTAIPVAAGAAVRDINIALVKGGVITGTVTNARTGAPVEGVGVNVRSNVHSLQTGTDAQGRYAASGLPTGDYVLFTYTRASQLTKGRMRVLDQVYKNVPCRTAQFGSCSGVDGEVVHVTAPNTVGNINFSLTEGGVISGVITDAANGAPIPRGRVDFFTAAGESVDWIQADEQGRYTSGGFPTGTYVAVASQDMGSSSGFIRQLYKGKTCAAGPCNAASGTPIAVTAPNETSGIDFALTRGGTMSGTVTDASTGKRIQGARISLSVSPDDLSSTGNATTDEKGTYAIAGLADGAYYVQASGPQTSTGRGAQSPRYASMLDAVYPGVACPPGNCRYVAANGKPVVVKAQSVSAGIDLALQKGGTISGRLINATTGKPVRDAGVIVHTGSGAQASRVNADIDGNYTSRPLPAGSYYLRVAPGPESGVVGVLYPKVPYWPGNLSVTTGTPIDVVAGADTGGKDFALAPGGTIQGMVTLAGSGKPVEFFRITVYTSTGVFAAESSSASLSPGKYTTPALPPGSYFVRTATSTYHGVIDQAYGGVPCPGEVCKPTTGSAVVVNGPGATPDIDFALEPGARISGAFEPDLTAGGGQRRVAFMTSAGEYAGSTDTISLPYTSHGLLPGSYYVRTFNASGFADQQYKDIPCPGGSCSPTAGMAVTTTRGTMTSGIDFKLEPGPRARIAIAPNFGPASGGTIIEIVGQGFEVGATTVRIGGQLATSIAGIWSLIKVVVPPGTPGPADIVVATPSGTITLPKGFTYVAAK